MSESSNRYEVGFSGFGDKDLKSISRKDLGKGGNRLFMEHGFQVGTSHLQSPEHPNGVVYLDGACNGPYMDAQRRIYSMDHHAECIRQITLATCMQAILFTRRRVIGAMGHKIMGNDPDLDTRLASWALLNADTIAYDDQAFKRVLPLFQLEGNIDGLGFGSEDLTGLSADQIVEFRSRLGWLMRKEHKVKTKGRWSSLDYTDFMESSLHDIDRFAFQRNSFEEPVKVDVRQKETLSNGQTVSFVRLESAGIYEVEKELLKDSDPACVILHDGKSKWTVKLSGLLSKFTLAPVWNALNEAELAEKVSHGITDERMLRTGWGGADNIGGAPRYPNGQGPFIDKSRIMEIVFKVLNSQLEKGEKLS